MKTLNSLIKSYYIHNIVPSCHTKWHIFLNDSLCSNPISYYNLASFFSPMWGDNKPLTPFPQTISSTERENTTLENNAINGVEHLFYLWPCNLITFDLLPDHARTFDWNNQKTGLVGGVLIINMCRKVKTFSLIKLWILLIEFK